MFNFAETTKDMTASEILNYYRNLYYAEPRVTEHGIVANVINDFFFEKIAEVEALKAEVEKLKSSVDDHFWDFCSISGCEGASNDCWKTCPDSRYNRTKSEAIKEFIERLNDERYDRPIEIDCDGRCLNCEHYDTTDCPDRR